MKRAVVLIVALALAAVLATAQGSILSEAMKDIEEEAKSNLASTIPLGKIVYIHTEKDKSDAFRINPDGSGKTQITSSGKCWRFAVSQDSSRLAYYYENSGIWVVNLGTGQASREVSTRQIEGDGVGYAFTLSHNGNLLYYADWITESIYAKPIGERARKICTLPRGNSQDELYLSLDGQYIIPALGRAENAQMDGLYLVRLSDGRITRLKAGRWEVSWMPDGTSVATLNMQDNWTPGKSRQPVIIDIKTKKERVVKEARGEWGSCMDFKVSPNGRFLAVATSRGLLVYDLAVGKFLRPWNQEVLSLAWSPDSNWICFSTPRKPGEWGSDLFVIRQDGSGLKQITSQGDNYHPIWTK